MRDSGSYKIGARSPGSPGGQGAEVTAKAPCHIDRVLLILVNTPPHLVEVQISVALVVSGLALVSGLTTLVGTPGYAALVVAGSKTWGSTMLLAGLAQLLAVVGGVPIRTRIMSAVVSASVSMLFAADLWLGATTTPGVVAWSVLSISAIWAAWRLRMG